MELKKIKKLFILFVLVVIIIILILLYVGFDFFETEKIIMTRESIDYFTTKYDIDPKEIKIHKNNFSRKGHILCFSGCDENIFIDYKGKTYEIKYNVDTNYYGDDYQYDQIKEDFSQYFNDLFPFVKNVEEPSLRIDVLKTSEKYDGNIEDYIKENLIHTTYYNCRITYDYIDELKKGWKEHSTYMINTLEDLGISYFVVFSLKDSSKYYSYFIRSDSTFEFYTNVDNIIEQKCERDLVVNGKCQ